MLTLRKEQKNIAKFNKIKLYYENIFEMLEDLLKVLKTN